MNEANHPTTVTVRALLAHFHGILTQARQTGEPVIIALRHRKPAGVLLGYETWQALKAQLPAQADTSALRAELAAERQRNSELVAELADTRKQAEAMSYDLVAAQQRVAELEARLPRPPMTGQYGETWGIEPKPEVQQESPKTGLSQTWGASWDASPLWGSGRGQR